MMRNAFEGLATQPTLEEVRDALLAGNEASALLLENLGAITLETYANGAEVPITDAATVVAPASTTRRSVNIQNLGENPVRLGIAGVTFATGFLQLNAGDTASLPSQQALYGIAGAGLTTRLLVSDVT